MCCRLQLKQSTNNTNNNHSPKRGEKTWYSLCRWNRWYASLVDIFPLSVWLFGQYCEFSMLLSLFCLLLLSLVQSLAGNRYACSRYYVCIKYILLRSLASKCGHFAVPRLLKIIGRLGCSWLLLLLLSLSRYLSLHSFVYSFAWWTASCCFVVCLFLFTSFVTSSALFCFVGSYSCSSIRSLALSQFANSLARFQYGNRQFYLLSSLENNDNCFNSVYYKYLLHYRICLMFFIAYLVLRMHRTLALSLARSFCAGDGSSHFFFHSNLDMCVVSFFCRVIITFSLVTL